MIQSEPLVLASQSAARAALLHAAGIAFEPRPAHIDEAALKRAARAEGAPASAAALLLAEAKARRIPAEGRLVVGADQILHLPGDGRWFDKPADTGAARTQLRALRGRSHVLATAVVCVRAGHVLWRHVAAPRLTMRDFSDAFLDAYLAGEGTEVLATVGAYRLEGPGIQLFDATEGEHAAILGLPMLPLLGFLRQHGVLTD